MARVVRKRKPNPPPASPLAVLAEKHLQDLNGIPDHGRKKISVRVDGEVRPWGKDV